MGRAGVGVGGRRAQDAFSSGLRWLVLKAEVAQKYPTLCDLVQRARQATGLAQRAENEIQLLQRIHGMAMRLPAVLSNIDYRLSY